jgi:hypothetical protein
MGMAWRLLLLSLLLLASSHSLHAVANYTTGTATPTYNTTAPTTQITGWQSGWTQPSVQPSGTTYTTGWNYVGSINGSQSGNASGVYLGYGWVITCAHLGTGSLNFTLNGTTYPYVANSVHTFTGTAKQTVVSSGTTTTTVVNQVDMIVFQVSPAPNLPALPLRSSNPAENTSKVVIIGYGDGGNKTNETWGYDTVNYAPSNYINLTGSSLWSNDFITLDGTTAEYQIVGGDSGGGDFIYNSTLQRWELAGLNEGNSPGVFSAFVQLNDSTFSTVDSNTPSEGETTTYTGTTVYATQIEEIITPVASDSPAMPIWALVALGAVLGLAALPSVSGSPPPPGAGAR